MNVKKKKKILKEIESTTPGKIRERSSLIAGKEKVLVVWVEDQTSLNIPLSQSLILFSIWKRLKELREPQKNSWKLAELGA